MVSGFSRAVFRKSEDEKRKIAFFRAKEDTPDSVLNSFDGKARKIKLKKSVSGQKYQKKFQKIVFTLLKSKKGSCIIRVLSVQG